MPTRPDAIRAPGFGPPGRISPAAMPRDTLKDGNRDLSQVPVVASNITIVPPGMFLSPDSMPPMRLYDKMSTTIIVDDGPHWPIPTPPGFIAPKGSRDNGLFERMSTVPLAKTYYMSKQTNASDLNSGDSPTVDLAGTCTVGTPGSGIQTLSSAATPFTRAHIGRTVNMGNVCRLITGYVEGRGLLVRGNNSSTSIQAQGDTIFTQDMVGMVITGSGFQANAVISTVTDASNAITSSNFTAVTGNVSVVLSPKVITRANGTTGTQYGGATGTFILGGPWTSFSQVNASSRNVLTGYDTVYVGPGVYRELVVMAVNPDNGTLRFVGDVDGAQMGVAGEVRITAYAQTDIVSLSGTTVGFNNGTGNYAFSNIHFEAANAGAIFSTANCFNTTFTNCAFSGSSTSAFVWSTRPDLPTNLRFDRCYFWCWSTALSITLVSGSLVETDANILITNCSLFSMAGGVFVTGSGAGARKSGGVRVRACSISGGNSASAVQIGTLTSNAIPCSIYDSIIVGSTVGITMSGNAGSFVEDYNVIQATTPRSGGTAGAHTISNTFAGRIGFHWGQERVWGGIPRPFMTPTEDVQSLYMEPNPSVTYPAVPTTDVANLPRPSGVGRFLASGTATSGTSTTLVDSAATFPAGGTFQGATCKIIAGLGTGQSKMISFNTATTLSFFSPWAGIIPDATSQYMIYWGSPVETFLPTSLGVQSVTCSGASWQTNQWMGFTYLSTYNGLNPPQTATGTVTTNTATTINLSTNYGFGIGLYFSTTVPTYLFRGSQQGETLTTSGAYERHDIGKSELTLTDAGGVAIALGGWSDQSFRVPVSTTATTISIKCSFDANYGGTNPPQLVLDANPEIGVVAQVATATGVAGSGTFETLTLSPFTATRQGWVTIRAICRADTPYGKAVFDTVTVT